jgi:hypothetical protein
VRLSREIYGSSAGYMDCAHGTGPANTTEFQSSWERDKTSQFVVLSISGNRSRPSKSMLCAKGKASPFADLERIVEDLLTLVTLVTAGTIQSNAQSVIIVVRKIPLLPSRDDSDEH